ncbi:mevalonate kinase [Aureococcus anophagefferens]|uniref:Mevalonate kinase n=1 Tax=Aureococcus anophagefferens TaxID=44056 RepID=A0ABR1G6R4_AURAN
MADDGEAPAAKRLRCERLGSRLLAGARGYGKLILLGEHFVVYKVPALVAAVGRYTDCDVALEAGAGIEVADHRPAVPGYKAKKGAEGRAAVALVLDHLGVDYAGRKRSSRCPAPSSTRFVLAAAARGAAGAKMSGTGRGGLMIALAPDEQAEAAIKAALEALAPQVWTTVFS